VAASYFLIPPTSVASGSPGNKDSLQEPDLLCAIEVDNFRNIFVGFDSLCAHFFELTYLIVIIYFLTGSYCLLATVPTGTP